MFKATFVSLFMIVTCDGWFEIQEVLDVQFQKDYPYYILARVLMMFIIIMGHFVIFNIFIGPCHSSSTLLYVTYSMYQYMYNMDKP